MTEPSDQNTPTETPTFDTSDWLEKNRTFAALCEGIAPINKKTVFDALAAAGITSIVVHFDGYGDSGQIEDIELRAGGEPAEFPPINIEIAQAQWGSSEIGRTTQCLRDAIETLAYDFLAKTHCGWENNEGAFGDFTFDVAARTITLDYNERIETSEHTQHVF